MNGPQILLTQQGAAASFDFTADFAQAPAGWAATAAETFAATATFDQVAASWAAVASEAFAATGSFSQAAAAWTAIVGETFTSTATWAQAAGSWDASANQTSDRAFSATFDQATGAWEASVLGPVETGGTGGKFGLVRLPQRMSASAPPVIPAVTIAATFVQPAGGWVATVTTNDDDLAILLAA